MEKPLFLCFFAKTSFEETIRVCAKKSEISGQTTVATIPPSRTPECRAPVCRISFCRNCGFDLA
jgi:transposase